VTLLREPVLRRLSYLHSLVYCGLLYVAFVDRHDHAVTVLGWSHGIGWIAMSALCIAAVGRRVIPLWLGVVVAVVGGVGPFAGSVGFYALNRRRSPDGQPRARRP
jgi:hypothetical protein